MAAASFPTSAERVTDAWLTRALRDAGATCAASVVRHRVEPITERGYAATTTRIELDYDRDEAGAPHSLIAKFPSEYEPTRELAHTFGIYRNEAGFYRDLAPDAGIDVPHCFCVEHDPDTSDFVLLLEDLSGAREIEDGSVTVADAEEVVRNLAPFHARWWNDPLLPRLDWLWKPDDPQRRARLQVVLQAAVPQARERMGSAFPDVISKVAERWLGSFDRLQERARTSALTLVHGDLHVGQMFFPSRAVPRFALFDWQVCLLAAGANDLARFVLMSFAPDEREACETGLVEQYHRRLAEHGVADYPLERCWEDYRLGMMSTAMLNIAASIYIDTERAEQRSAELGIDWQERTLGWPAAALEHHRVLDLIA